MLIYLIGYMGSGKSTVGKKLAKKLNYTFIDLDQKLENEYSYTIPDIFSQFDEKVFRMLEQKILHKTFQEVNTVVSTGGGTPCFFNNMELMKLKGLTIYLEMNYKSLAQRLRNSKKKRPLILDKTEKELIQHIQTHLSEREQFYKQAAFSFDAINPDINKLQSLIHTFR